MQHIKNIIVTVLVIIGCVFFIVLNATKISASHSHAQIKAAEKGEIARDGWVEGEAYRCYDVSEWLSLAPESRGRIGTFDFLYKNKLKSYYALLTDGTMVPVRATAKWYSSRFTEEGMPKSGTTVKISGFAKSLDRRPAEEWEKKYKAALSEKMGMNLDWIDIGEESLWLKYITRDYVNVHAYRLFWLRIIMLAAAIAVCLIRIVVVIVRGERAGARRNSVWDILTGIIVCLIIIGSLMLVNAI